MGASRYLGALEQMALLESHVGSSVPGRGGRPKRYFVVTSGGGLYGVLSCGVSQRTREVGIRIALGVNPGAMHRAVLTDGLRPTGLGLLIGASYLPAHRITRVDPLSALRCD